MAFFLTPWVVLIVGWLIHVWFTRRHGNRTGHRVVELALLWVMVGFGVMSLLAGLSHIGPNADEIAAGIGYAPSMFQWEVGWADLALGVLAVGTARTSLRDGWLTAAVVTMAIMYWGDAIGHIMQWQVHDNTAPNNVWAIPADIAQPLLALILLVAYRRTGGARVAEAEPAKQAVG